MNTSSIKKTGFGILIGAILMIGVQSVSAAWPPPSTPPSGNVAAPVNTGSFLQLKSGTLGVTNLLASESVDVGASGWLQSPRGYFGPWSNGFNTGSAPFAIAFGAFNASGNKGLSIDTDGNIQIKNPAFPGAVGKVLTSDAGGYATWQPADGGLPPGAIDQTLRHDGTSWVATGIAGLKNNGTDIYQGVPDTSVGQGDYPVGNDGEVKINDPLYVGNNLGVIGKTKIYGNTQTGSSSTSPALDITGKIKIVDGTQGADKILTSDASGLASWQTFSPTIYTKRTGMLTSSGSYAGLSEAYCYQGDVVISGGVYCSNDRAAVNISRPYPDTTGSTPTGWSGACTAPFPQSTDMLVYVVCMDV